MLITALTQENLEEALTSLGRTPSEIAHSLGSRGYKGIPRCPTSCILSQYLSDITGLSEVKVYYSDTRVKMYFYGLRLWYYLADVEVLTRFLYLFDSLRYPNLTPCPEAIYRDLDYQYDIRFTRI